MKRKSLCIIATASLFVALFTGCDALDSAMDYMSKNVYEESGLVKADTETVNEVKEEVTGVVAQSSGKTVSDLAKQYGFETGKKGSSTFETNLSNQLSDPTSLTILSESKDPDKLTKTVAKALASESAKDELVKELNEVAPAEQSKAARDSMKLLDAVVAAVDDDVLDAIGLEKGTKEAITTVLKTLKTGVTDDTKISKGDVLVIQMTTNVIYKAMEQYTAASDPDTIAIGTEMLAGVQNIQKLAKELDGVTQGFFDVTVFDLKLILD